MTTINLKDFYYWYTQDQFIEVTEEVAGALRASIRYEAAYSELAARINSAPLKKSKSKRLEDAIAAKVLAPGDRDHILSGVFNQFLSALTEPVE